MEGGTEFDLKSIDVQDETEKNQSSTSSDKQPKNGWFLDTCAVPFLLLFA